ncbi:helix-turn-helix domain-containing protein [Nocardioides sp. URHA0020]|uniref:helix-turn-helix domain-containing protein n=1 Tax=Nocardioides sp. URHA0020 TaxID=1380392 RepID=UPI00048F859D|nr:helix-turn-helix domain-containing protein [Nocardioides sp. URHA0020]
MPKSPESRWLPIADAAIYLDVAEITVRRLISRGELRGYKIRGARLIRIDRHELDALMRPIPTGERADAS